MIAAFERVCLTPHQPVRDAIDCIDRSDAKIALVVDADRRLLDTITDGDVRRAVLAGVKLDTPVSALRERKIASPYPKPVTAPIGTDRLSLLQMMEEHQVRHIPLLDDAQRVVGLMTRHDLVPAETLPLQAVVMAGGFGTRLRPLTENVPKPMLPVGGRPLLERILQQLRDAGIHQINVAGHYKKELINDYFGDGRGFGVQIAYVEEDRPLGTAGALGLLERVEEPLLVINGDILTRVDFRAMLDFHREHRAQMTVAVRVHEVTMPFGVVETDGVHITGIAEKPVVRHWINGGIYLLNPKVCELVPKGRSCDMPELISRLIAEGKRVVCFPVHEYWLDIGATEQYEQALADIANQKV